VHLLVGAISKTRTTPNHKDSTTHNLESDRANRTDDADRGGCDLAVFGTLLCPLSEWVLRKQLRFQEIALTHPPGAFCAVYGRE
jgi:hypothetical protein